MERAARYATTWSDVFVDCWYILRGIRALALLKLGFTTPAVALLAAACTDSPATAPELPPSDVRGRADVASDAEQYAARLFVLERRLATVSDSLATARADVEACYVHRAAEAARADSATARADSLLNALEAARSASGAEADSLAALLVEARSTASLLADSVGVLGDSVAWLRTTRAVLNSRLAREREAHRDTKQKLEDVRKLAALLAHDLRAAKDSIARLLARPAPPGPDWRLRWTEPDGRRFECAGDWPARWPRAFYRPGARMLYDAQGRLALRLFHATTNEWADGGTTHSDPDSFENGWCREAA